MVKFPGMPYPLNVEDFLGPQIGLSPILFWSNLNFVFSQTPVITPQFLVTFFCMESLFWFEFCRCHIYLICGQYSKGGGNSVLSYSLLFMDIDLFCILNQLFIFQVSSCFPLKEPVLFSWQLFYVFCTFPSNKILCYRAAVKLQALECVYW